MLLKAQYQKDKIVATHGVELGPLLEYNADLRKDSSNGWTKERNMRKIAQVDGEILDNYGKTHPDWKERMFNSKDIQIQRKAWHEFCNDTPYGYGYWLVNEKSV